MRLPIGTGIRQRNELRAAEARKRGALLELKAAEVELANTILGTHRRVENLASVAGDFAAVAASSRRLLDSELARLDEGKSESRRVLEVESKLADAQIAELESRGDLARARIELDLASGRLLRERGLDLALVGRSRSAR